MPYWLFSQTNTTGSSQSAARFSASWNAPSLAAPSPKKQTATLPAAAAAAGPGAAPTAIGMPPPTMPLAPSMPMVDVGDVHRAAPAAAVAGVAWRAARPSSGRGRAPLAMQWPWPRWVEVMRSSSRSARHAPTATGLLADRQVHGAVHADRGRTARRPPPRTGGWCHMVAQRSACRAVVRADLPGSSAWTSCNTAALCEVHGSGAGQQLVLQLAQLQRWSCRGRSSTSSYGQRPVDGDVAQQPCALASQAERHETRPGAAAAAFDDAVDGGCRRCRRWGRRPSGHAWRRPRPRRSRRRRQAAAPGRARPRPPSAAPRCWPGGRAGRRREYGPAPIFR